MVHIWHLEKLKIGKEERNAALKSKNEFNNKNKAGKLNRTYQTSTNWTKLLFPVFSCEK